MSFLYPRIYKILYYRPFKKCLTKIPYVRRIYNGWWRKHPFDVFYGTDTSGFVPVELIHPDKSLNKLISPYAGSQPDIVRRALSVLPDHPHYSFIDLGCGKGRATIVASEFPFREIGGIELSSDLASIAGANVRKVSERFPDRTPIIITQGNIASFNFPKGKIVLFIYHAFGRELMSQFLTLVETHLSSSKEHLFIVYNNPVCGDILDASPVLTRWYADSIPYDRTEIGYGPDLEETVVIWQSVHRAYPPRSEGANRPIILTDPLWRAELA